MKTDIKLVSRAKKGDKAAFNELYEQLYPELYRYAAWFMGSESYATEALLDATLTVWQKLPQLRKEENFKAWYYKILSNCCKKIARDNLKNSYIPLDDTENFLAEENALSYEDKATLQWAMTQLRDDEKEIILLAVCGGYTSAEIGKQVGKSDGTVRSILSRGLKKLKKLMDTEEL